MPFQHQVLRVYETDPMIVVGFGEAALLNHGDIAECREEIRELVKLHGSKAMAFDMRDVQYVPSVVLGLLASLTRVGIEVHLWNLSAEVQHVLEVTHLAPLFKIHEHAF